MRKMGEYLLFKLRPIASGNDGHLDHTEKVVQQSRHFSVDRRFTFGKCAVQIEYTQLFHDSVTGNAISSKFTRPRGRKVHAPTTAGNRNTSPFPMA